MLAESKNVDVRKVKRPKIKLSSYLFVAMAFVALVAPASAYSIGLSKTTDRDTDTYGIGDTIKYTLRVTNPDTVNCTLNVTDLYPDGKEEILNSNLLLEPGVNATYQRSYVVQAADVEPDKTVKNTLKVEGVNVRGEVFSATVTKSSKIFSPLIAIIKTASLDGLCPGSDPLTAYIGDTVTYCFTVINTGDVNLTNIHVTDDPYGSITLGKTSLVPNESTKGTLTYVVTESDAPSLLNNATVDATAENSGLVVRDYGTCTVYITALDGLVVKKTASPTEGVNGTEVTFTITVSNLKEVALSPVYINDSLPQDMVFVSATDGGVHNNQWVNWTLSTLAASSSKTVYLVTRINVTGSGTLTNHVNVTGNSRGGMISNATTTDVRAYVVAPTIVSVVQSRDSPVENESVEITAHVTDALGVASVNLTYINRSNDMTTVSMNRASGTTLDGYWNATIPGQPAGETLTIYVTACDVRGNCTSTTPHFKHWTENLTSICPFQIGSRPYPVFPQYTLPPVQDHTWYPHFPRNAICSGRW
ncbi:MAG: DUF11 domain-containing protein [Halobacteriota archaeon]